jgi:hypothetical protein
MAIEHPFNFVGETLAPVAEKCIQLITQLRQILDQRLILTAETLKQTNILSLLRDTNKMVINEKDIKVLIKCHKAHPIGNYGSSPDFQRDFFGLSSISQ